MDPNLIIDRLGGTTAVAALCNVAPQAVSQWREKGIPEARAMYLRVLRPDAFAGAPTRASVRRKGVKRRAS